MTTTDTEAQGAVLEAGQFVSTGVTKSVVVSVTVLVTVSPWPPAGAVGGNVGEWGCAVEVWLECPEQGIALAEGTAVKDNTERKRKVAESFAVRVLGNMLKKVELKECWRWCWDAGCWGKCEEDKGMANRARGPQYLYSRRSLFLR